MSELMSGTGAVVLMSILATVAGWLVVTGWRQPRPLLTTAVQRLRRPPLDRSDDSRDTDLVTRIGEYGMRSAAIRRQFGSAAALRIIGRPVETHVGYLVVAAIGGLVLPSLILGVLNALGIISSGVFIPVGVSIVTAAVAPLLVHSAAVAEADERRIDLRHQLSAYLDMMTMLLAGNAGHEAALQQAAEAGDGLLFRELRRRMREVATTGQSLVTALTIVADDFELPELDQVASAAALSAAEGSPVAKTLAAKCSTLRSTLAADDEARARVRNDKVTPPLVGMAVLFMALLIYPALSF
jgi:tight adherence protein C